MTTTDAEAIARDLNGATSLVIEQMHEAGMPICMREGETTWRTYHAGFDLSLFAQRITDACCDAILSYLASRREAIANDDIADALERCDWSGAPIGNKAIIASAIERLRENVLFCEDAADHLALIDYISDKIGLPKDEELSRETFSAWLSASRRGAQEPVGWMHEDELPKSYPYDRMFPYSQIRGGVRMFPVYTAPPSPAPAGEVERMRTAARALADWAEHEVGADIDLTPGLRGIRAALNGGRE